MTAARSKPSTNKKPKTKITNPNPVVDLSDYNGPFSFWNHRVVKRIEKGEVSYSIHEVHYNPDGSIYAMTTDPVEPFGETLEELKREISRFSKACSKEILEYDKIRFARNRDIEEAGGTK